MSRRRKVRQNIISEYQHNLLNWFYSNGRNFPWRQTSDPFHILVAEILLRQTGASNIVSAYEHIMSKYPSPSQMAKAPLKDLECIIRPLGLRSRAGNLIKLSQMIDENHGGVVPSSISDLQKLPGVGQYIANAVACLCFGYDSPLVDRGIGRVVRRVFGLASTKPAYLDRELWAFAGSITPSGRAGEYNLALIDLAALVCKPRQPICSSCPLKKFCICYSTKGESLRD